MYIIAIAWTYVVLLIAVSEPTLTASIMTFLFYGVLPLTLFFYLVRTPQRKRNSHKATEEKADNSIDHPQEESPDSDQSASTTITPSK
jgi:bacteriorhodopsin